VPRIQNTESRNTIKEATRKRMPGKLYPLIDKEKKANKNGCCGSVKNYKSSALTVVPNIAQSR